MNEEFDFTSPDEKAALDFIRELFENLPEIDSWVIHPINYPRICKKVEKILAILRKAEREIEYTTSFDELLGIHLCLTVCGYCFSFADCKELAEAISLADSFDMEATLDGKVRLLFDFHNARIPAFPKKEEKPDP